MNDEQKRAMKKTAKMCDVCNWDKMIKYRGKRKDNSEWVKGGILHYQYAVTYIIGGKTYIIGGKTYHDGYGNTYELSTPVLPETVGMFTGLNDKNGIEIYSSIEIDGVMSKGGDIVKSKIKSVAINPHNYKRVVYGHGYFGLQDIGDKHGYIDNIIMLEPDDWLNVEIIGNQTDNPELMEKPNDPSGK
ncbi:MAG: YopX family protein [Patescibacteria group bacterium]